MNTDGEKARHVHRRIRPRGGRALDRRRACAAGLPGVRPDSTAGPCERARACRRGGRRFAGQPRARPHRPWRREVHADHLVACRVSRSSRRERCCAPSSVRASRSSAAPEAIAFSAIPTVAGSSSPSTGAHGSDPRWSLASPSERASPRTICGNRWTVLACTALLDRLGARTYVGGRPCSIASAITW